MATTTNYGWETPDDTDLVKDGASAIRTLGSSIDTTLKAQIDAQIPDTIIDAKGDLIVGTADNTPAKLSSSAVNGDVLQVDTSTASGLKWGAVAAGAYTLLSTTSVTGSSVSITSISSSYTDLYIQFLGISTDTTGASRIAPNGDTTLATYYYQDNFLFLFFLPLSFSLLGVNFKTQYDYFIY